MGLTTAEQFLVIVLSIFLAIFLVLGTIALSKLIQVLNRLKKIADQASNIADNVEATAEFLRKSGKSLAFGSVVSSISKIIRRHKGSRKG